MKSLMNTHHLRKASFLGLFLISFITLLSSVQLLAQTDGSAPSNEQPSEGQDPASPNPPAELPPVSASTQLAQAEAKKNAPLPPAPNTPLPPPDFSSLPAPEDINSEEEAMAALEALFKMIEAEAAAQGESGPPIPPPSELFGIPPSQAGGGGPRPGPPSSGSSAADSTQEKDGMIGPIVLVDETAHQVVELLQKLTGKTILMQQTLPPLKVNFNSIKPLPREEAIIALESVLSLNGVAITPVNKDFLKAVPTVGINTQAPEILENPALDKQPSQKVYSKFYTLNYLSTEEALPMLQPFLTPGVSSITPFPKSTALLITDALINLQRVETVLLHADRPVQMREEILFFPLENITAAEMQKRLEQLYDKSLKNYLQGSTTFDADERTNQFIVITHASNIPTIRRFVDSLDVDSAPITQSRVFTLKHADAPKVVEVIQQIINGQKQSVKDKEKDLKKNTTTPELSVPGSSGDGGQNSLQFSDYITIVADERSNAIVTYGTRSDLSQVENLVEEIDVLLPQVRIEVVISEVTLNDDSQRGIDSFGITWNENGSGVLSTDIKGPQSSKIANRPFTLTASGNSIANASINALLQTAQRNNNVSILSAPTIVTTHNQEATIEVVQQRPIITAQNTDVTNTNSITNTINYKDIGITLKVKPLIGIDGVIQMEITQKVEDVFGEQEINGVNQPLIGKREAKSFVSVSDKELIILGGLQENKHTETERKMFILGQMPIIGSLFTSVIKEDEKRELIIFIKPHLIATPGKGNEDAEAVLLHTDTRETVESYLENGEWPKEEEKKPAKPKKSTLMRSGPRRS